MKGDSTGGKRQDGGHPSALDSARERGPSLDTLDSLVGRWFVHVIVCGIYTGAYKFDTEEQAQADAADRRRKFGVLGCRYIVAPNAEAHASATKEP